jgi:hypothetical protein
MRSRFGRGVFFDLPDESEKGPDKKPKVHDEVGGVQVES